MTKRQRRPLPFRFATAAAGRLHRQLDPEAGWLD